MHTPSSFKRAVTLASFLTLSFSVSSSADDEKLPPKVVPADLCKVRNEWLNEEDNTERKKIAEKGEALFPALEHILADPTEDHQTVGSAFGLLSLMTVPRPQFVEYAHARLGDKAKMVRLTAVQFLATAGGESDTGPVAVLLLDSFTEVRFAAAATLVAIGGKKDLTVFDLIIRNADRYLTKDGTPILVNDDVTHLEECRAKLELRIKMQEREKKEAVPKSVPKVIPPEKK